MVLCYTCCFVQIRVVVIHQIMKFTFVRFGLWTSNMMSAMCHVHVRNPMSPLALAKVVWSIVQQSLKVSAVTITENICDFSFRDDEYRIRDICYSPLVDGKHTSKAHDNDGHCWGYSPGWGLLKLHPIISPPAKFSILEKYLLESLNHIHVWQVSLQPSSGDTCQI